MALAVSSRASFWLLSHLPARRQRVPPQANAGCVCDPGRCARSVFIRVAQDCREHSSYLPQSYPAEFFFPLLTKRVAADCDCWRAACSEPANDSSCENPALPRQQ